MSEEQKINLKDKKLLVWDGGGLAMEHAVRLAQDFGKVWYFTHYYTAFPEFKDYAIGLGMEGLEKVKYFADYIDDADMIMFADIGFGDWCHYLRQKGKVCYGGGLGERLENQRYEFRKLQHKIGLPTQRTALTTGVSALRKYLTKHHNQVVKLDVFRGSVDSFPVKTIDEMEHRLTDIEMHFGPYKEKTDFIVEEFIKADLEIGVDGFFNGFEFIRPLLIGIEAAKTVYIGRFVEKAPSYLEKTLTRLTPTLKKLNYRGAMSTEERVVSEKKSYLIDISARFPFPLSAIYTETIDNYPELIWSVAHKEAVRIKPKAEYVGVLPLESSYADKNWVNLKFDHSLRDKVKLRLATKVDGGYTAVKGMTVIYVLLAWGDSVKGIIKDLEKLSEKVHADALNTDVAGLLHKIEPVTSKLGWR